MITLIKTYVSNPSSRATSRHPDDGSTSHLRGRRLYSMALPDTKRVGRGWIIFRGGRPIVTCVVLLCALFFYDNDSTHKTKCDANIPIIVFRLIFHFSSFADLSRHQTPSRAVSSPGRASASAAAAGAADPLSRCRTRSREASTSESTTGISVIYGAFLPSQRFDAMPRHRNELLS